MSESEYPTQKDLDRIEGWKAEDYMGLVGFVMSIWHWPDYAKLDGNKLELHTGGWSGNEDIIASLSVTLFWLQFWECTRRGGHYYFELPAVEAGGKVKG